MKTLIMLVALLLSGCAGSFRIPEVQGKLVDYKRTDPFGGTQVMAKEVVITADKVKADEVVWTVVYPQFTLNLRVVGYEREREKPKAP